MKNYLSAIILALVALSFYSCCTECPEEMEEEITHTPHEKFNIYKNKTDNQNADMLQAQYIDDTHILNFYGTFGIDNSPQTVRTITYQKINSDTIVNFLIDEDSNQLSSMFYSVKNINQPIVLKFNFLMENSNSFELSFYDYNWTTNKANLYYSTIIENTLNSFIESPIYTNKTQKGLVDLIGAIGVGIATAEVAFIALGASSPLAAASGAIIAALSAPIVVTTAALIATAFIINAIINEANASEIRDLPQPKNTPLNNPITENINPIKNLYATNCRNSDLNFSASMDSYGDILVWGVTGGQKPYIYKFDTSLFQESEFFLNRYKNGTYFVAVKDANGCVRSKIQYFTRENFNYIGTWVMTSYNNQPMGTTIIEYPEPDCPNTAIGSDTLNSFTLEISTDATTNISSYRLRYTGVGDYINLYSIDENCKVTVEDRSGGAYSEDWTGEFNASDGTFIVEEEEEFFSIVIHSPNEIELKFEDSNPNRLARQQ